ncbi:restriction endonuclease [Pseudomonas syringae]|uniref:restriction endonuclease n=1 Tax=Pseudomonas syringae TaxID=317 RepID=UPI003F83D4B9
MKSKQWYEFQEQIAEHFRTLGVSAKTNISVEGVRTFHDVDVLVSTKFLGAEITWIVEAKSWKSKVPKEKVLALRSIVDDTGADRGFLISEKGFQSGAWEAAHKTNVELVRFADLKDRTRKVIQLEMLQAYERRAELLVERYFSHSKSIRIEYGLRDDPYNIGGRLFSGQLFIGMIFGAIERAQNNQYPMNVKSLLDIRAGEDLVENYFELASWLNVNLNMFDEMLLYAENAMILAGDFRPTVVDRSKPEAIESYQEYQKIQRRLYILMGKNLFSAD